MGSCRQVRKYLAKEVDGTGVVKSGRKHHQQVIQEQWFKLQVKLDRFVIQLHVGHLWGRASKNHFPHMYAVVMTAKCFTSSREQRKPLHAHLSTELIPDTKPRLAATPHQ